MREIVVFTDGDVDVPKQYQGRVEMIPQYYYFNPEEMYGDEQVLDRETFFENLKTTRAYTAGANPDFVRRKFTKVLKEGKDIVCVACSSGMSGTYNTIYAVGEELKEEYQEATIEVIDSLNMTMAAGFLCADAVDAADEGKTAVEVAEIVRNNVNKLDIYFIVDEFKYLVQGGRVSPAVGKIGDVLNIKVILTIREGKIVAFKKVRGQKMAFKTIRDIVAEKENARVGAIYVGNQELFDECKKTVSCEDSVELNLIISSHVGPNTTGIAIERKE